LFIGEIIIDWQLVEGMLRIMRGDRRWQFWHPFILNFEIKLLKKENPTN